MADKQMNVGVKYTGDAKDFKKASEEARKATAQMRKEAEVHSKEIERKFKDVTIAVAKIGGALVVAQKAFQVYAAAMKSTEATADKFEAQMATLQGAVQGAMITLFGGNWLPLIENIKRTAEATRDLKVAIDELNDISAGNTLKKSGLNYQLQNLKVQIAGTGDPATKQKLISDAINVAKQITAIEVEEQSQRVRTYVDYYSKLLGVDEQYRADFQKQIALIAQEWKYLSSEAFQTTMQTNIRQYEALGSSSGISEAEYNRLKNIRDFLGYFIQMRDSLSKPDEWNKFIGELAKLNDVTANGEESIRKLTGQFLTAGNKIADATEEVNEYKRALDRLSSTYSAENKKKSPGQYAQPGGSFSYADVFKKLDNAEILGTGVNENLARAQDQLDALQGTFETLFSAGIEGWDSFGKAAMTALKQIFVELAAKAALLVLLFIVTGGEAKLGMDLGKFILNGFGLGGSSGGGGGGVGSSSGGMVLKGRDIAQANARSVNVINRNT